MLFEDIQSEQSNSAKSAKVVVVEPKFTCAHPSFRHRYPAIVDGRAWVWLVSVILTSPLVDRREIALQRVAQNSKKKTKPKPQISNQLSKLG